ncbi:MAG: LuxR C-terminal-related transcriptional regulator [Verrucomicrobiota bacterium]
MSTDSTPMLPEDDVRKIVSLLGSVIASTGSIHEKRHLVMEGLCDLIGASSWVWSVSEFHPDKPPSSVGLIHSGFDETRMARYLEAINHPAMEQVSRPSSLELMEKGKHLTRTRAQMDPEGRLDRSEAAPLWIKADIGPLIMSLRPMEGGGVNAIRLYRTLDQPHFNEREAKIAHIILSEIPWLHFEAFPDARSKEIVDLYPRHRTVLNCLCEGWSRKKIAEHLGLSVNTVHGYSKIVFKHFGVHSQSELIARLTQGDGGDR